jgi:hypothetical protein
MATTLNGENRSRRREKIGTTASVNAVVATVINGSAVAGHAVRKAASRNAFEATWCASMMPAVAMAMRVKVRFTRE